MKEGRIYNVTGQCKCPLLCALSCIYVIFMLKKMTLDSLVPFLKNIRILSYTEETLWNGLSKNSHKSISGWSLRFFFFFSSSSCAFAKMNIRCQHSNKILLSKREWRPSHLLWQKYGPSHFQNQQFLLGSPGPESRRGRAEVWKAVHHLGARPLDTGLGLRV